MAKIPLYPEHPERICWGCDLYCPADDMRCGNGTIRTQHPIELLGENWLEAEERPRPTPLVTIAVSSQGVGSRIS